MASGVTPDRQGPTPGAHIEPADRTVVRGTLAGEPDRLLLERGTFLPPAGPNRTYAVTKGLTAGFSF